MSLEEGFEFFANSYLVDDNDPSRLSLKELEVWDEEYPCFRFMRSYGLKPWRNEDCEEALLISQALKTAHIDYDETVEEVPQIRNLQSEATALPNSVDELVPYMEVESEKKVKKKKSRSRRKKESGKAKSEEVFTMGMAGFTLTYPDESTEQDVPKSSLTHNWPSNCTVPYFEPEELYGREWEGFKFNLEMKVMEFRLKEAQVVNLLVEATSMHPKLYKYMCKKLDPASSILSMPLVQANGKDWMLQSMQEFATQESSKLENNNDKKIEVEKKEDKLTTWEEELATREEELAVHNARVEELIGNKAKEMRILWVKIDEGGDSRLQMGKKVGEIDTMMSELESRMKMLQREKEELKENMKLEEKKCQKNVEKKEKVEMFIEQKLMEEKTLGQKIEKRVQELRKQITSEKEDTPTVSSKLPLVKFISDQILEKEKELECPVCLHHASSPIFSCMQQHLICRDCRPRVKECPECRAPYGQILRHRYAERAAEELEGLKDQRRRLMNSTDGD